MPTQPQQGPDAFGCSPFDEEDRTPRSRFASYFNDLPGEGSPSCPVSSSSAPDNRRSSSKKRKEFFEEEPLYASGYELSTEESDDYFPPEDGGQSRSASETRVNPSGSSTSFSGAMVYDASHGTRNKDAVADDVHKRIASPHGERVTKKVSRIAFDKSSWDLAPKKSLDIFVEIYPQIFFGKTL